MGSEMCIRDSNSTDTYQDDWLTSTDECEWFGLNCSNSDGIVTEIDLREYLLSVKFKV